ncbi:unnamed protein product [Phyllotreta striolata]|uniref:Double-stranded RNA-specific editase Adar n=1 Tax=Phyllotreta striolata TaxID=444603 RepID=A0A9N9TDX3_PHYSR|nr:unnamed protein product [Phyllotreta striolata]
MANEKDQQSALNGIANNQNAGNLKRKVPGKEDQPKRTKKRKHEQNIIITDKNPISLLNELRTGLKYELIEECGPSHCPTFKLCVEVDGKKYYGLGNSKRAAKSAAAAEALKSFIQFPTNGTFNTCTDSKMDFTSDQVIGKNSKELNCLKQNVVTKGSLMLLNELYPNSVFTCFSNERDSFHRFKIQITIDNETFVGTGPNKKSAKNAAASAALCKLTDYPAPDVFVPSASAKNAAAAAAFHSREHRQLADAIGRLINDKFSSLMADDVPHMRRKVISGIVMTRNSDISTAQVICVTTGTKCISGEYISMTGATLNDMHAEILSRRCLLLYFYDQLDVLNSPEPHRSIFERNYSDGRRFKLKDDVEFHLFINTAPCGDARIFSPHEDNNSVDKHPSRLSRGQLRTKIESGEGTIPVKNVSRIQTWDGILQGERLLTMSCSDKICRWNVLGLQGALLSYFLDPIYLKTIVLGSLLKESHLYRAICGRIESTLQGLPPPFLLNRPGMLRLTSTEVRQALKAPNFSVIWTIGMDKPEVVNCNTGKLEDGRLSLVCKQNLCNRFSKTFDAFSDGTAAKCVPGTLMEAKEMVANYNQAKRSLYDAFAKGQLGSWVTKPIEQDWFDIRSSGDGDWSIPVSD